MINRFLLVCSLIISNIAVAQTSPTFEGIYKWKDALSIRAASSLKSLYSTDPPAAFMGKDKKLEPDISPEIDFWQGLVSSGASNIEVSQLKEQDQQGLHIVNLAISMKMNTPNGPRTRYVTEQQAWQRQGDGWRIVMATHSEVLKMRPALKLNPNLYDKNANARAEIREAVARARIGHQRVILVFGGSWCYDCQVLDQAFHQPDVAPILRKSYQVVHVDIGDDGKKNNDLAAEYKVPLEKGVPALDILDADGKLLYSQENGDWEKARSLDPDDVIAFLKKWKS
jgi:hypothetical protein